MRLKIVGFMGILGLAALLEFLLMAMAPVGSTVYAIKLSNVSTGTTVSFGTTSSKVAIVTPSTNTAEVCLKWTGPTNATCPSANTAGDDLIPPGTQLIVDDISVTGIGLNAVSGTQTIYIRAWR